MRALFPTILLLSAVSWAQSSPLDSSGGNVAYLPGRSVDDANLGPHQALLPKESSSDRVINWKFLAANGLMWSGIAADGAASIRGVHAVPQRCGESNSFFHESGRNPRQFNQARYWQINGAIGLAATAFSYLGRRKHIPVLPYILPSVVGSEHWVAFGLWEARCR